MNRCDLFVWTPDRSSTHVRVKHVEREGGPSGLTLPIGRFWENGDLTVYVEDGEVPDFLYDPGLRMFVSIKVRDLVSRFDPDVQFVSCVVKAVDGTVHRPRVWLNPLQTHSLLDTTRAQYTMLVPNVFGEISFFEVDSSRVPEQSLFVCQEIGLPVFSSPIVTALKAAGVTGAMFTRLQGARWPIRETR